MPIVFKSRRARELFVQIDHGETWGKNPGFLTVAHMPLTNSERLRHVLQAERSSCLAC